MPGKFVLSKSKKNGKFSFNLHATNGRVILTSEQYNTKAAAKNGIKSVQKNCGTDKRFDRRTAKNGKPYFCLCAANGEVIGRSEMYSGHSGRNNGIASVKRNAPGASVVDES